MTKAEVNATERASALKKADEATKGVPWSHPLTCHLLFDLAVAFDHPEILEISCCYGKATAYLAAAARLRDGRLQTVDNLRPVWQGRDAADLVAEMKATDWSDLTFGIDARWWLLDLFTADPDEWIDLAFVDAAHSVEVDSFIVLSVWTHLKQGGILILDDLNWTSSENGLEIGDWPYARPDIPHVRKMYDYIRLLPDVDEAVEWGGEEFNWPLGLIRKAESGNESDGGISSMLTELPSIRAWEDR